MSARYHVASSEAPRLRVSAAVAAKLRDVDVKAADARVTREALYVVAYHTGVSWGSYETGTRALVFTSADVAIDYAQGLRSQHPEWHPTVDRLEVAV